jgi:hypothetical protein
VPVAILFSLQFDSVSIQQNLGSTETRGKPTYVYRKIPRVNVGFNHLEGKMGKRGRIKDKMCKRVKQMNKGSKNKGEMGQVRNKYRCIAGGGDIIKE